MVWNPSPKVAVARDAARRLGADRIVLIYTTAAGQIGSVSYGKNKRLCASAKELGDEVYDAARTWFEVEQP